MSTLVESLKRLYEKGKVTDEKLELMRTEGKITDEEKQYITSGGSAESDVEGLKLFHSEVMEMLGGRENA